MKRLIAVAALVAVLTGGAWAQPATPPCTANVNDCEFLAAAYEFAAQWKELQGRDGYPDAANALAEEVIETFALWLEINGERLRALARAASDDYQDLARRALAGDKVAAARLAIRAERIMARSKALTAERHALTEGGEWKATAERFYELVGGERGK